MDILSGQHPTTHNETLELWGAYGQLRDALKHIIILLDEGSDDKVWDENLDAANKILKIK
jgi:hypothetical protein